MKQERLLAREIFASREQIGQYSRERTRPAGRRFKIQDSKFKKMKQERLLGREIFARCEQIGQYSKERTRSAERQFKIQDSKSVLSG
jgi:hypothetical protein